MSESREKLQRKLTRLKVVFYILGGICIVAILILGQTYYKDYDESWPYPPLILVLLIVFGILIGLGKIIGHARSKAHPILFIRKMFLLDGATIIFGFIAFIFGMYCYIAPVSAERLDSLAVPSWLIPPGFFLPIKDYFLAIALTSLALAFISGIWVSIIYTHEERALFQESMGDLARMGRGLSNRFSKKPNVSNKNLGEDKRLDE